MHHVQFILFYVTTILLLSIILGDLQGPVSWSVLKTVESLKRRKVALVAFHESAA